MHPMHGKLHQLKCYKLWNLSFTGENCDDIPMTSTLATIDRDMMHNMGSLNALKSMHGHPSLVTNAL